MDINYEYYKIFYNVAKYGGFTAAAEKTYSNQPNLTRTIKKLENELGVSLFYKSGKHVRLTPEGAELYAKIAVAVEQIENAEREISEFSALEGGYLAVSASEAALHKSLLPALETYKKEHPKIKILLSNHSSPQAIAALKNGQCELAVISVAGAFDPALEYEKIADCLDVPVCRKDFFAAAGNAGGNGGAGDTLNGAGGLSGKAGNAGGLKDTDDDKIFSIAELAAFPLISLGRQTATFDAYTEFFRARGLDFRPAAEVATADQILPLVDYNLGVGLVPDVFLKKSAAKYLRLKTDTPLPSRSIYLVRRAKQPVSFAAKSLIRMILQNADEKK